MAGLYFCFLLFTLKFGILHCSKRYEKMAYRPYGLRMCTELCQDTPDTFYFLKEDLSCHRIQLNGSSNTDNTSSVDSLGCHIEDDNSVTIIPGRLVCHTGSEDESQSEQTTSGQDTGHQSIHHFNSSLHQACTDGNVCMVQYMISKELADINCRDKLKRTPVMMAARKGHFAVFDYLVKEGCNISGLDERNENVLHYACEGGKVDIVRKLVINLRYDLECSGKRGMTPLMISAFFGNIKVFDFLLREGSLMNVTDVNGANVLHLACSGGNVDMVKHIMNMGKINMVNRDVGGRVPAHYAAYRGRTAVVKHLRNEKWSLMETDFQRRNILHFACRGGDVNMVRYILSQRIVYINSEGKTGHTPVMEAAYCGHVPVVKLLESTHCQLSDSKGNNILHAACKGGHVDMVKYIISQQKFSMLSRNWKGRTPFWSAAYFGRKKLIKFLLNNVSKPGPVDREGNNLLHIACMNGREDLVQYLLSKYGIDSKGFLGRTPVIFAAMFGHERLVKFLLERGCNPYIADHKKLNFLHIACTYGHIKIAEYIISQNIIGINCRSKLGRTPVMTAAYHGQLTTSQLLVRKGCDMKVLDNEGSNILHLACLGGHVDVVEYFNKLDTASKMRKKKNKFGNTPIQVAMLNNHKAVVVLLKEDT